MREARTVYAAEAPGTETVPTGYKQTQVGVIPEDWEVVPIGALARFTSGAPIKSTTLQRQSSEFPVPVFGGNGIAGYTSDAVALDSTVVVGRVGQKCGSVYRTDGPSWVTDNALYPKHIYGNVDLDFLALALEGARLNEVRNRNDLPLVTQAIVHSVQVALPPTVSEQRATAAALSDADVLIAALDKLISKKRAIKSATMQQLLTGKQHLPGFSEEWKVRRLGELGNFSKGKGIRKNEVTYDGVPCIRYGEIYTLHHDYVKRFYSFVPMSVAKNSQRMKRGDLLFTGSGETAEEIGKCVAYLGNQEAYAGGDIVIFSPADANSMFLGYLMNQSSVVAQKSRMGQGDAVVHISASNLAKLRFALPPKEEQAAIVAVLSDMDAEIEALEARREKTRQVKQGMMQELLTGRTRLV